MGGQQTLVEQLFSGLADASPSASKGPFWIKRNSVKVDKLAHKLVEALLDEVGYISDCIHRLSIDKKPRTRQRALEVTERIVQLQMESDYLMKALVQYQV